MPGKRKSDTAQLSASSDDSDGEPERIVEEGGIKIGDIYIPPPPPPVCSLDTGAPRLIITRIVNKNFKSYAGVQELGPFHKCFTSIIGPNGSGKSNVIDSMLFVFGYRGSKIRSKKISSLIHSSENHKTIQSCSVSVYFKLIIDKDEDYEEVPNSQFYVSRTGFKDNSSTYEIDGRRVPFKEVSIKLKKFGIDLDHNRFLILQGEVEQIAMMKPKGLTEHDSGMLEYLEDIIGTSRFKEPIEKLGVVVSELNDDRAAKVHKVRLVETEKKNMQGAYEEAIAFLKTENYITELRNTEYQKYIYDTEINKKQKEEKKNEIKTELETIAENIKEFIKKRKKLEDELSSKYEEKTKLEEKLQNLRDIFKQIDTKDNSARADMVQTNDRRKKSKTKLEEEKKKLLELEKVPEKNTADIKEIEKKLPKLAEEREKLETQKQQIIAEIAELTRPLQDERYRKESELIKLRENENKAKTELNLAETQLKVFVQNEKDATQTLEKIRTTYENSKKTLEEKQKLVEEHNRIFPAKEQELQQSNVELLELRNESKRIQEQVYTLTAKIEESRSSMQRAQFRNRVLNFLMKLKEQGVLPGILGRLGDLGAIDPKYDVAVSTACGPLDYIVVDTVDTANKCVNALKQQNIGRGNFMALEKMEYLRDYIQQRVKTPENIPRLYDLIQFKDQRLMTAFYFGVRETLVANDLEQATRIAYGKQRYRVVTLNGDMIELVGTMSGGGRTKISGRMGSKILVDTTANTTESPERIERYEQKVRELSERLRDMDNTKYDLERKVDQLSREVERMRSDLRKYVAECEAVQINLPNLERQIKQQEKVVQTTVSDKNRVKELEATIEAKRKQFEKENKIAGKLQEEVDALSEEISQQDGGRLKRVQNRLKEISQNIDKLKSESTRLTVGIKNAERNAVKCKNTIERIEESIQNDSEKILQIQQERVEIEADARNLNEKIQKMEEDLNEIKTDESDTEIKNEINELTKNEHKCKEDKINLEHELSTVEKTIKEFINNLSHWRKALSKLTLHTIPDNEVEIERLEHSVNSSKANTTVNNTNANTSKANVTGASIRTTDSIDNTSRTTQKKELRKLTDEELENCNVADIQYTITFQQDKLSKKPNLNIIEEYKKIQLEYCKRVREVEEVTNRRRLFRDALDKAKKTRENEFLTGYQIINLKLKEMYQMITLGGDAELELVDSLDPFNDGISFSVRPPKKSWKNICNLSGGEKTLSSLALVFALHYYKPSPLYVMDEIDAALDFKNVSIVGNYIKDRTKNAQFIIISLRSNMFELADRLVGIYKTYNCTKSVSVNPAGLHEILLNSLNQLQITIPTNQQLSQAIVQSQQSQPQPLTQTQQEQVENEPSEVIPTLQQNSAEINKENVLPNGIN